MTQADRVAAMENRMNEAREALDRVEAALDALERLRPEFAALADYYGSEDWFADIDAHERGALPASVTAGVLTEDLPYDVVGQWKDTGLRMIEMGLASVKQV